MAKFPRTPAVVMSGGHVRLPASLAGDRQGITSAAAASIDLRAHSNVAGWTRLSRWGRSWTGRGKRERMVMVHNSAEYVRGDVWRMTGKGVEGGQSAPIASRRSGAQGLKLGRQIAVRRDFGTRGEKRVCGAGWGRNVAEWLGGYAWAETQVKSRGRTVQARQNVSFKTVLHLRQCAAQEPNHPQTNGDTVIREKPLTTDDLDTARIPPTPTCILALRALWESKQIPGTELSRNQVYIVKLQNGHHDLDPATVASVAVLKP
ncbi:hypothetical protein DFH07DRAFT_938439 [Mycena maculata]|uniref:Uncharacterized protein n=1 Tax=Mycena maculata TaxID=230809 RepID=A0AAD7JNM9_9AGAR|nr:hypothetical protein DFH07DRAFT_938439 [Mycena maculata]